MAERNAPIGIFDSGFGGLTIFDKIREALPDYDYIYLGDNARTPYGTRSYDAVYRFTREAVMHLFAEGCPLIILACNTASAKALRTIQQRDLPAGHDPARAAAAWAARSAISATVRSMRERRISSLDVKW